LNRIIGRIKQEQKRKRSEVEFDLAETPKSVKSQDSQSTTSGGDNGPGAIAIAIELQETGKQDESETKTEGDLFLQARRRRRSRLVEQIYKESELDVGFTYRIFAVATVFLDTLFMLNLMLMVIMTRNSGAVLSLILFTILGIGVLKFCYQLYTGSGQTESWYSNFRLLTIGHVFVTYIIFWIGLAIMLLEDSGCECGFWDGVRALEHWSRSVFIVQLVLYLTFFLLESCQLFFHAWSKDVVDKLASRNLFGLLQNSSRTLPLATPRKHSSFGSLFWSAAT